MKLDSVVGLLIVAVLCFYGVRMVRSSIVLHAQRMLPKNVAGSKAPLVFQSEGGIDVSGNFVGPLPPPKENRAIVFLLRGSSVTEDLTFWQHVSDLLPEREGLRLIAYCEDDACVAAVKQAGKQIKFPVIVYGEVIASQALIEADAAGDSLERSESWLLPKKLPWRLGTNSPDSIIKEALR